MNRQGYVEPGKGTVADIPDAPLPEGTDLLTLERELIRSIAAFNDNPCNFPDEEFTRWGDYNSALENRIAEMPAKSYAEVSAKLRRVRYNQQVDGNNNPFAVLLVDTALEAIERLAATVAENPDAELLDLERQYFILEGQVSAAGGDEDKVAAIVEQEDEVISKIAGMAARTMAGVAAKLRIADNVLEFYRQASVPGTRDPAMDLMASVVRDTDVLALIEPGAS